MHGDVGLGGMTGYALPDQVGYSHYLLPYPPAQLFPTLIELVLTLKKLTSPFGPWSS